MCPGNNFLWSAAASEARRRFCLIKTQLVARILLTWKSQSGVALRLPPHSIKLAVIQRVISYGLLCGQIHANDLLIIPGVHVAVCEGGMRPEHITSGRGIGGLEQMRAADLLVTFGAEPGDD